MVGNAQTWFCLTIIKICLRISGHFWSFLIIFRSEMVRLFQLGWSYMSQEIWWTQAYCGHPSAQRPCYAWDISHHVAISPGPADSPKHKEDCSGCLEWLSQHPIAPWRQTLHNFHHAVGALQIQGGPTRFYRLRWCIHSSIRWNNGGLPTEN